MPAVSTTGNGQVDAEVARDGDSRCSSTLRYRALESAVTQSHIHFGQEARQRRHRRLLLHEPGQRPGRHAAVPAAARAVEGVLTVTGTRTAADMAAARRARASPPGEFDELVRALRAGATYANVHSDEPARRRDPRPVRHEQGHQD